MRANEGASDIKAVNHTTNPANHTVKTAKNLTNAKQASVAKLLLVTC